MAPKKAPVVRRKKKGNPELELPTPTIMTLDLGTFERIVHISDIHLRPLKRHVEYTSVFNKLYDVISRNDLVVVTGDIFDKAFQLKPETVYQAKTFFRKLGSCAKTLVIGGNHDMAENDPSRMDAIYPICGSATDPEIPNVFYLKNTGVYNSKHTNHSFVVSSLLDKLFISFDDVPNKDPSRKYVALYHGYLEGTKVNDLGTVLPNSEGEEAGSTRYRSPKEFEGFDAVLLGDIHKRQVIRKNPYMAYAGSLIQQNHGEAYGNHGYLLWNATDLSKEPQFHPIDSEWGFVDVLCHNGEFSATVDPLPPYCTARLIIKDCTDLQVELITKRLKTQVKKLVIDRKNTVSKDEVAIEEIPIEVLRMEDEVEIIKALAEEKGFDPETMVELHKNYQESNLKEADMSTKVWRPVQMEWKNLFGYNQSIEHDFLFEQGVTSITANNACGKTSMVNTLMFGLYGRTPLDSGNGYPPDVLNAQEEKGYVRILLKHGGSYYLVERTLKRDASTGVVKQDGNVYQSDIDGTKGPVLIAESGVRKRGNGTLPALSELVGELKDFNRSNLLNKDGSEDLLTMTPGEQIKALERLFKMDVYDGYKELNKKQIAELTTELEQARGSRSAMQHNLQAASKEELQAKLDALVTEEKQLLEDKERNHERLESTEKAFGDGKARLIELRLSVKGKCTDVSHLRSIEELERRADEIEALEIPEATQTAKVIEALMKSKLETLSLMESQISTFERKLQGATEDGVKQKLLDLQKQYNEFEEYGVELDYSDSSRSLERIMGSLDESMKKLAISDREPLPEEEVEHYEDLQPQSQNLRKQLHFPHMNLEQVKERLDQIQKIKAKLGDKGPLTALKVEMEQLTSQVAVLVAEARTLSKLSRTELINSAKTTSIDALKSEIEAQEANGSVFRSNTDAVKALKAAIVQSREAGNKECHLAYNEAAGAAYRLAPPSKKQGDLKALLNYVQLEPMEQRLYELRSVVKDLEQCEEEGPLSKDLQLHRKINGINYEIVDQEKNECENKLAMLELRVEMERLESMQKLFSELNEKHSEVDAIKSTVASMQKEHQNALLSEEFDSICYELDRHQEFIDNEEAVAQLRALEVEVQDLQERYQAAKEHCNAILQQLTSLTSDVTQYQFRLKNFEENEKNLQTYEDKVLHLEKALVPLNQYNVLMGAKGLVSQLLFNKLKSFEEYINAMLRSFTKYQVIIQYNVTKKEMVIALQNKDNPDITLGRSRLSGYEKLILQVAFKSALNKFSFRSKSNIMIIDEALDCIDTENFEDMLPNVINMVNSDYYTCLAISQRDISHISDNTVRIKRVNGVSQLV